MIAPSPLPFAPFAETAARMTVDAIFSASESARDKGERITRGDAYAIAQGVIESCDAARVDRQAAKVRKPRAKSKPIARNQLFDALAEGCGYDKDKLTKAAARTIGAALSDIRGVCSEVTCDQITRIATAIRRKYDNAGPMAVAAHWHEFAPTLRTKTAKRDVYTEPNDWRMSARAKLSWSDYMFEQLSVRAWGDIPIHYRSEILAALG